LVGQTKQIDGFTMSMPWPLQPVLDGSAVVIASGSDGDPADMYPFGHNVFVAKPETCERRKSACAKLGKAMTEAIASDCPFIAHRSRMSFRSNARSLAGIVTIGAPAQ
jgi:hypothetical protein